MNRLSKFCRTGIVFGALAAVLLHAAGDVYSAEAGGGRRAGVDKSYTLHVGDKLNIKIYPEDEYLKGGDVEVSSEGNITLPLVGKIAVAGLDVVKAEQTIAEVLSVDYLVNPQVVIEVLEYQASNFVVLGEVVKPGTYQFPAGVSRIPLLHAVSMAGGFSEVANIKKIKIMRKSTGETLRANAEEIISGRERDMEIVANDVIHVSESLF